MKISLVLVLFLAACSTVTLSRVDHCTVQRSKSWAGSVRDEIVFCDRDAPHWSDDRALRLTQECLYEADLHRRDLLILSARSGHSGGTTLPSDDAFSRCYPDTVRTVQAENDALRERIRREDETRVRLDGQREKFETTLDRQRDQLNDQREKFEAALDAQREKMSAALDTQRERMSAELEKQRGQLDDQRSALETRMEGQHEKIETELVAQHGQLDEAMVGQNGQLQATLSKALDRPVNAVAEAHASSDSDVKHNSDSKELAHFDYASQPVAPPAVTKVVERTVVEKKPVRRPRPAPTRVCAPPPAAAQACVTPTKAKTENPPVGSSGR